jgi:3-deoxy-D-manno-octulosonate 8-phosphate phosphatase (KDO 8-P phosphatase)
MRIDVPKSGTVEKRDSKILSCRSQDKIAESFVYNPTMSKARAKKIKVILFDVDGVLTDGTIWLLPAPAGAKAAPETLKQPLSVSSDTTVEAKGFHAHDGTAISLARLGGIKVGFVTKRNSETVAIRARDLKIDYLYQGMANKVEALEKIVALEGISGNEVAFVGDDVVDLPIMRRCGLAIAVPNARAEVKKESHFITKCRGGEGACRDAIEYVLKAQGKLEATINEYIETRPAVQREMKLKSPKK